MANKTEQRIMSANSVEEIQRIIDEAVTYNASEKFFRRLGNANAARQKQLNIAASVRADAAKRSASAKKAAATRKANAAKVEKIGAALTKAINK